jgi:hypothetical protein
MQPNNVLGFLLADLQTIYFMADILFYHLGIWCESHRNIHHVVQQNWSLEENKDLFKIKLKCILSLVLQCISL